MELVFAETHLHLLGLCLSQSHTNDLDKETVKVKGSVAVLSPE